MKMETKLNLKDKRQPSHQILELSYQKISFQLRKELINLVMSQEFTVYRASKILNINNSTAKAIIRKYRRNGSIFMRKSEIGKKQLGQVISRPPENQERLESREAEEESREQEPQQQKEVQFYYFYPWGFQNCYNIQGSCFMTYY